MPLSKGAKRIVPLINDLLADQTEKRKKTCISEVFFTILFKVCLSENTWVAVRIYRLATWPDGLGFFPLPSLFAHTTAINAQAERRPTPTRDSSRGCWEREKKKKWSLSIKGNRCRIWPKNLQYLSVAWVKVSLTCEKLLLSWEAVNFLLSFTSRASQQHYAIWKGRVPFHITHICMVVL